VVGKRVAPVCGQLADVVAGGEDLRACFSPEDNDADVASIHGVEHRADFVDQVPAESVVPAGMPEGDDSDPVGNGCIDECASCVHGLLSLLNHTQYGAAW